MFVIKRNGARENVMFDKVTERISRLCYGLDLKYVDPVLITQKIVSGVYNGVTTNELDNLSAETAAYMVTIHPDYGTLAARISASNLHKNTLDTFSEKISKLFNYSDPKLQGKNSPLVSQELYELVKSHTDFFDSAINYERDYDYTYFGLKTLYKSYLLKINGEIVERPQDLLMRVSIGIHGDDLQSIIETYELMSLRLFTHATPTLFNSGTPLPQMSSCFLLTMKDDSIEGIYETLKQCALISKTAGGVGLAIHNIRASGSYICGTNGISNGIVPMLRVFSDTARYVDQGGGKRKGSFAIYLEPWHADIYEFLDLRKNHGKEELRARDLFLGLWVPDLFMERVENNQTWTLFCPNEAPGLSDCYGDEFRSLYLSYEQQEPGIARKVVKAQQLWFAILESQVETGNPYIVYKDSCNRKSNQKNLGTIKCSNLCTEIIEYTSPDEVAVCNLASIALPQFVNKADNTYDFYKLQQVTRVITRNLNRIIDRNYYPVKEAEASNMKHRPVGLGVQGLADVFMMMNISFDSTQAYKLNQEIFESIYFAALSESCNLAQEFGPYTSYLGSPMSQGLLQMDFWEEEVYFKDGVPLSKYNDWKKLRRDIMTYGVRNSLLIAPMPTASTSQILGNNECVEPYTSNIYTRRVLSGEFTMVNKHLVLELIKVGLWNPELKDEIIAHNGSIQNISRIPDDIKSVYKTVWEYKQKVLIDMAIGRSPFIDQSQSLNLFIEDANFAKLTSMHFYTWKNGLKTGMYYLRTKSAVDAIKFTVAQDVLDKAESNGPVCRINRKNKDSDPGGECLSCGS